MTTGTRAGSHTVLDKKTIENHMRRVIELARRGEGKTSPNPLVGSVIVKNGKVIGEGYHKKAGQPHAEMMALRRAGSSAKGAGLWVNLEPCVHYGRTPPCTDAIIAAGIKQVFIGMKDPNPLVRGKGIRRLRQAGIQVVSGILRKDCERLNEVFDKFIRTKTPFVIMKSAVSLDGKIATRLGESKWISSAQSRRIVHDLRNKVDAIMVGAGTVVKDDPQLIPRLKNTRENPPARVILDNENIISARARVFKDAQTHPVVYCAAKNLPRAKEMKLKRMGVQILKLQEKHGGIHLKPLMKKLGGMGITSVLAEGGGDLNASLLREKVADKIFLFVAPIIIGGKNAVSVVGGEGVATIRQAYKIKDMTVQSVGPDLLIEGYF